MVDDIAWKACFTVKDYTKQKSTYNDWETKSHPNRSNATHVAPLM